MHLTENGLVARCQNPHRKCALLQRRKFSAGMVHSEDMAFNIIWFCVCYIWGLRGWLLPIRGVSLLGCGALCLGWSMCFRSRFSFGDFDVSVNLTIKQSCRTLYVSLIQISPGFRDTIGTKQRTTSLSPSFRWQQKSDTEDICCIRLRGMSVSHTKQVIHLRVNLSTFFDYCLPECEFHVKIKAMGVIQARKWFASSWISVLYVITVFF